MPRKHWRDFSLKLKEQLTQKDIKKTEEIYERWDKNRELEKQRLNMTEEEYIAHMAKLCGDLWGTGEQDVNDELPR